MSGHVRQNTQLEKTSSGVSWSAVIGGAAASAALALILIVLGIGLGMSTISPWPSRGIGASTFGVSAIAWLVLTQIIAAAAGGYLAGRLRIKWATIHTDEVYFRDTAHGFLAWALAALITASLVGTVTGAAISATASAGVAVTAAAVGTDKLNEHDGTPRTVQESRPDNFVHMSREATEKYLIDSLFRRSPSAPDTNDIDEATRREVSLIFANSIHQASLPLQDQQYLSQIVAKHTGLDPADASKRVNDTFTIVQDTTAKAEHTAMEAADKARKTTAYTALWMFVSLLCGAFISSFFATFGGKQRDRIVHVAAAL